MRDGGVVAGLDVFQLERGECRRVVGIAGDHELGAAARLRNRLLDNPVGDLGPPQYPSRTS